MCVFRRQVILIIVQYVLLDCALVAGPHQEHEPGIFVIAHESQFRLKEKDPFQFQRNAHIYISADLFFIFAVRIENPFFSDMSFPIPTILCTKEL